MSISELLHAKVIYTLIDSIHIPLMQRRFVHLNLFMLSLPESFAHDAYTDCFMTVGTLIVL